MTPADETTGSGGMAGAEPATPAMGAATPTFTADPLAGGNATGADAASGGSRIRDEAMRLREQAADKARAAAAQGKDRAAGKIDGIAQAAHDAASRLEEQAGPQVGRYAHQAADALDRLSEGLRTKSVDELVDDARAMVRANPAVAIGAAFAIGFVLSRFLKATSTDTYAAPHAPSVSPGNGAPRYDA